MPRRRPATGRADGHVEPATDPANDEPPPPAVVRRRSVRTFLIWLVLACLLPGVVGATILFLHQYREGRAQQQKDTIRTARALVQAVDTHLLKIQAAAAVLATSDALANGDLARFHARARAALASMHLGTNVILRDGTGRQVLNTAVEFGQPLPPAADAERVRDVFASGKPTISDVFFGPVLRRPIMTVDVPVSVGGKITHVLGIGLVLDDFSAILENQRLPPDWIAVVFDGAGTIVGRTRAAQRFVGQKVSPALRDAPDGAGAVALTTEEGIRVTSFHSRSPVTNWGVAIGIPRDTADAGLARTLAALAFGVAALFGIGLLLARAAGRRIAHSVKALIGPAAALGSGRMPSIPELPLDEAARVAEAIARAGALLEAREAELAEAHRLAKFGTWHCERATGKLTTSESVPLMLGRKLAPTFANLRGTALADDTWERLRAVAREALRSGKGFDLELDFRNGSDSITWIHAKSEPVRDAAGTIVGLRGTALDISDRKLTDARVRDAALHDLLTGLPNRALVFEYCGHLLAAADRGHRFGALLLVGLDRFKRINERHGHQTGDRALQEVGRRLAACTRHEDLVGRLGGDEFVVILPHLDESPQRAAVVAQHILDAVGEPLHLDAVELALTASVGIGFFPEHAGEVSRLVHAAELAMHDAKRSGGARYRFYSAGVERSTDDKRESGTP